MLAGNPEGKSTLIEATGYRSRGTLAYLRLQHQPRGSSTWSHVGRELEREPRSRRHKILYIRSLIYNDHDEIEANFLLRCELEEDHTRGENCLITTEHIIRHGLDTQPP